MDSPRFLRYEEHMTEGYYWAKYVHEKDHEWEVVEVWDDGFTVSRTGCEMLDRTSDFAFGCKIEPPTEDK